MGWPVSKVSPLWWSTWMDTVLAVWQLPKSPSQTLLGWPVLLCPGSPIAATSPDFLALLPKSEQGTALPGSTSAQLNTCF